MAINFYRHVRSCVFCSLSIILTFLPLSPCLPLLSKPLIFALISLSSLLTSLCPHHLSPLTSHIHGFLVDFGQFGGSGGVGWRKGLGWALLACNIAWQLLGSAGWRQASRQTGRQGRGWEWKEEVVGSGKRTLYKPRLVPCLALSLLPVFSSCLLCMCFVCIICPSSSPSHTSSSLLSLSSSSSNK